MQPHEIAARIGEMKAALVYSSIGGLILSFRPDRAQILERLDLPVSGFIEHGRRGNPNHRIGISPYFHAGQTDGATNLRMIDAWPSLILLELGSLLSDEAYFDKRPLLEFVRHVRNAIAHGGHFHIKGTWWRDAVFEDIRLSKDYHGTPLKNVMRPGDLLALIDAVEIDLRNYTSSQSQE